MIAPTISRRAGALLERWVASARSTIPSGLLLPGGRSVWADVLSERQLADPAKEVRGRPIDVLLEDDSWIARDMQVPPHAKKRWREVLQLESRANAGLPEEDLTIVHVLAGHEAGGDRYVELTAKRAKLNAISARVSDLGGKLRSIGIEHPTLGRVRVIDRRRHTDLPIWIWWGSGVAALALTASIWALQVNAEMSVLTGRIENLREENKQLDREISEAQSKATASEERSAVLLQELEALAAGQSHAATIADVSRIMPNEAWATEFSVSDRSARLAGFSQKDVLDLLDQLAVAPTIQGIELSEPVRTDRQRGVSRFEFAWTYEAVQ